MFCSLTVTCKFRCKDTNYILINTKKLNFFSANVCEIMLKIKNWQRLRCQFLKGCALYNIFYCILLRPSQRTFHVPSWGKPGLFGLLDNNFFPIDNVETFASLLHAHTIKIIDGID